MTTLSAKPRIVREDRPDGGILLRSAEPLGQHPATILHSLREWATLDPEHPLVAERTGDGWRTVSYGEAVAAADAIGQGLLDLGLEASRPLLVLSGNSVDHLLLLLGAMTAGIPVAPTSTAYSLQSQDHERIREVVELVSPGAVFADDAGRFGSALDAVPGVPRISSGRAPGVDRTVPELRGTVPSDGVRDAFAGLGPDTLAKILFTSGSTGSPKGVLTTHGMLASNQQMMRQVWPFLSQERPAIVDWLPWSHTFGGSHNLNMMIVNGGTIYVDGGPAPAAMSRTLANLADVPPTIFFNVPAGYAQLVPVLENDAEFAARFFTRMRLLFNAAAALHSALRERLCAVAQRSSGRRIPVTGSWGLTETAPAVTNAHFQFDDARQIGVPLPGAEVLLAPVHEGHEIRVRGPMVTPGYVGRPDLTEAAFDDDGFYQTGDGVQLADESDPDAGLLFVGRVAEDFKLSTGTFVRVGAVRTGLLSALPVLTDAVTTRARSPTRATSTSVA